MSVSDKYKHSSPKYKYVGPSDELPNQNTDILQNVYNDFDYISIIYRVHLSK
jgi:hypothetical protein